jgi:hypothetical protein
MLTAAKGIRVLVGVIRFFYPSDIQSSCKAKKMCFLFLPLQRNRELQILVSFLFDPAQYGMGCLSGRGLWF